MKTLAIFTMMYLLFVIAVSDIKHKPCNEISWCKVSRTK